MNTIIKTKNVFNISLIYSIISSFLIYKNPNGITMPFFVILTLLYMAYYFKSTNTTIKKDSYIIMLFIFFISISSVLTNYNFIVTFNIIMITFLFIIIIIHNYVNDEEFLVLNYIASVLRTIFLPIFDISEIFEYEKLNSNKEIDNKPKSDLVSGIFIGILISILLLSVILPLLISSDMIYSKVLSDIFITIFRFDIYNIVGFIFTTILILFASFIIIKYVSIFKDTYIVNNKKQGSIIIGATILISISFFYIIFSFIQIAGLFMNKLALPINYTYAEYAREGFFQLLFVSIINLLLIIIYLHIMPDNNIIKILLTIISICTYIMIISSSYRMYLYINEYDLTHLRFFVCVALVFIFLILTGAMINTYNQKFSFSKYSLLIFMIIYTLVSLSKPCVIISKYNITHKNFNDFDYKYLTHYSTDAAKIIYDYYIKYNEYYKNLSNNEKENAAKKYINDLINTQFDKYFDLNHISNNFLHYNLSKSEFMKYYDKYNSTK